MRAVGEILCWWAACTAFWLLTVSVVDVAELTIAIVTSAACGVFARRVRITLGFGVRPARAWLGWLWAVPRALASDLVLTLAFLVHRAGGKPATARRTR